MLPWLERNRSNHASSSLAAPQDASQLATSTTLSTRGNDDHHPTKHHYHDNPSFQKDEHDDELFVDEEELPPRLSSSSSSWSWREWWSPTQQRRPGPAASASSSPLPQHEEEEQQDDESLVTSNHNHTPNKKNPPEVWGLTLDYYARGHVLMSSMVLAPALLELAQAAAALHCSGGTSDTSNPNDSSPVYNGNDDTSPNAVCRIHGFRPSSLITNIAIVAGLLGSLCLPFVGAVVDHTPYRRAVGLVSAWAMALLKGVEATIGPHTWMWVAGLQIVTSVLFNVHAAAAYAYLTELTHDPHLKAQYNSGYNVVQYISMLVFLLSVFGVSALWNHHGTSTTRTATTIEDEPNDSPNDINNDDDSSSSPLSNNVQTARISQVLTLLVSWPCFALAWQLYFRPRPAARRTKNLWTRGFVQVYQTSRRIVASHRALCWTICARMCSEAAVRTIVYSTEGRQDERIHYYTNLGTDAWSNINRCRCRGLQFVCAEQFLYFSRLFLPLLSFSLLSLSSLSLTIVIFWMWLCCVSVAACFDVGGTLLLYFLLIILQIQVSGFAAIVTTYLKEVLQMSATQIGLVFFISLLTGIPGSLLGGFLSVHFQSPVVSALICNALCIVVTTAASCVLTGPQHQGWPTTVFFVLWGMLLGWLPPVDNTIYMNLMPTTTTTPATTTTAAEAEAGLVKDDQAKQSLDAAVLSHKSSGEDEDKQEGLAADHHHHDHDDSSVPARAELMGLMMLAANVLAWLPPLVFSVLNELGFQMAWSLASLNVFFAIAMVCLWQIGDYARARREATSQPLMRTQSSFGSSSFHGSTETNNDIGGAVDNDVGARTGQTKEHELTRLHHRHTHTVAVAHHNKKSEGSPTKEDVARRSTLDADPSVTPSKSLYSWGGKSKPSRTTSDNSQTASLSSSLTDSLE